MNKEYDIVTIRSTEGTNLVFIADWNRFSECEKDTPLDNDESFHHIYAVSFEFLESQIISKEQKDIYIIKNNNRVEKWNGGYGMCSVIIASTDKNITPNSWIPNSFIPIFVKGHSDKRPIRRIKLETELSGYKPFEIEKIKTNTDGSVIIKFGARKVHVSLLNESCKVTDINNLINYKDLWDEASNVIIQQGKYIVEQTDLIDIIYHNACMETMQICHDEWNKKEMRPWPMKPQINRIKKM